MRKLMIWVVLAALLLPGMAWAAEGEVEKAMEVFAPGFAYYSFGTEAARLVRLQRDGTQVAGGLFVLPDGYLSVGYEMEDDTMHPYPAGKPMTCLNPDLSVRWTLTDPRLDGAWYSELLELDDALVLGEERSAPEQGQAPSLMLVEKDTGAIRWQLEGDRSVDADERNLVWIGGFIANPEGNLLVGSNGDLLGMDNVNMMGTLSLVDARDGTVQWTVSYLEDYGVTYILDMCLLGDGLVIYGAREEDQVVLYTDLAGKVRGWFPIQAWEMSSSWRYLSLIPVSGDAVYLCGWETEQAPTPQTDVPEYPRSLHMMRLDEKVFENVKTW